NTFKGDSYQSIDLRLSRTFKPTERLGIETIAEAFNLFNIVNVRFFNTVYGAADFCPFNATAQGCSATQRFQEGSPNPTYGTPRAADFCPFNATAQGCSATQRFQEGSPNPTYGTPRAVYNPRQVQLAL